MILVIDTAHFHIEPIEARLAAIDVLLIRHSNHSTTQRYLGTINDVEAIRWINNIYAQITGGDSWDSEFAPQCI